MQAQIREIDQDITDFYDNFDNWKSAIEMKRATLQAKSSQEENLPPIRIVSHKKKRKTVLSEKKSGTINGNETEKIKSHDHKSKVKFAVKMPSEKVSKSEDKMSESENDTDDELETERRLRLSVVKKDEGNKCFKEGKYEEAVEKYTAAIGFAPGNPLLYANRAIALFKLERYASSEGDCSTALNMNPQLVKGLYRRAQARKALGKTEEAINDLKRILDIEPRNSAALKDLSAWTGKVDLCPRSINSLYKLINVSEAASSGNFCRIKISEVGSEKVFLKSQKKSINSAPSGDSSTSKMAIPTMQEELTNSTQSSLNPTFGSGNPSASTNPTPTMRKKEPPTNWFQLERDLRELIPSDGSFSPQAVDYLCSLEPQNYESVIGGSLTSSCLGRLVTAVSASSSLSSKEKAERLRALANLPRFSVAWMLAEDSDRQAVDKLLQEIPTELSKSLKLLFE